MGHSEDGEKSDGMKMLGYVTRYGTVYCYKKKN